MASDEDLNDFIVDDTAQESDRSPGLPLPPGKRRRLRAPHRLPDSDDEDDVAFEVMENRPAPRRGRRDSNATTVSNVSTGASVSKSGEEDEEAPAKKPKHKIIYRKNAAPLQEKIVHFGTQAEPPPSSLPWQIRGPIWRLPRPQPEPEQHPEPPRLRAISPPREPAPPIIIDDDDEPAPSFPPPSMFGPSQLDLSHELDDLPSDAFSSSPEPERPRSPPVEITSSMPPPPPRSQRLVAPQSGLRQTTLFGGTAVAEPTPSQAAKVRNYRVDKVPEPPTHHVLNQEALKTWVFPMNLGTIRDYQYSIVKNGLSNNLLVALPTGLGKTFIAATIMLNFYRWTKDSQIVFLAPTKPLVAQQVHACFNIAGIPRSETVMLTGDYRAALRREEWAEKRVFFMTPQTLENDLRTGNADPKRIVLVVVDEAHRATGKYAYVKCVELLRTFSKSFRILALTATPGSTVESVQEVIDGLEISKVEIRTEESIDIQQFVHRRNIEKIILEPSDEMNLISELFSKTLKPLLDKLCGMNAFYKKDPMSLNAYALRLQQKRWMQDAGRRAAPGLKFMVMSLFSVLGAAAHCIKLLLFHGIGSFYNSLCDFRSTVEEKGEKGGKYRQQITGSPHFKEMMDKIQMWLKNNEFIGHPKLTSLCETILNHFLDRGAGGPAGGTATASSTTTRVIVFSEFRESAEEITTILNRHRPLVRATVFVGQADAKRSKGMRQAEQQQAISDFKSGKFNVLVATSVGEEGLDIGEVDLIVCYDVSASPIRMLQRMGRTGRKRDGNIVLLMMAGKEERNFLEANDNYEKMQKMIESGERFNFRHDLSTRIIPKDITPVVDKRIVEIPFENTQVEGEDALPVPKPRRISKAAKKPPKKFNMPDGVETGFQKASKLTKSTKKSVGPKPQKHELLEENFQPIPDLDSVLISRSKEAALQSKYLSLLQDEDLRPPALSFQHASQRVLRPTHDVTHGDRTKRFVRTVKAMRRLDDKTARLPKIPLVAKNMEWLELPYDQEYEGSEMPVEVFEEDFDDDSDLFRSSPARSAQKSRKRKAMSQEPDDDDAFNDSDLDKDLDGFVVDDDEDPFSTAAPAPKSQRRRSPSLDESLPDILNEARPASQNKFFEPMQFMDTQESNDDDDDIPDLGVLLGRAKGKAPVRNSQGGGEKAMGARGGKRMVVEDSDDDDF